jgi:hypothetical protein
MLLIAALGLFVLLMVSFLGFIRFCEWILSRREIMS